MFLPNNCGFSVLLNHSVEECFVGSVQWSMCLWYKMAHIKLLKNCRAFFHFPSKTAKLLSITHSRLKAGFTGFT